MTTVLATVWEGDDPLQRRKTTPRVATGGPEDAPWLPHDVRGFLHKRIIGAVGGFITGGPSGAIAGAIRGGGGPTHVTQGPVSVGFSFCPPGFRTRTRSGSIPDCVDGAGNAVSGNPAFAPGSTISGGVRRELAPPPRGGGACIFPARRAPDGSCQIFIGDQPGPDMGGEVMMGRFGPAMSPDFQPTGRNVCLPGMVLGRDNLCYNARGKGSIPNRDRKWPRPTRPLMTGGDVNAVNQAARVAKKLETKIKQLQKIGLLKKPSARKAAAPKRLALPPGITVVDTD